MRKILIAATKIFLLLFWILLMLSFSDLKMTFLTIVAATIHELGHIAALMIIDKKFSFPRLVSSGFRIKSHSSLSYREEIFVCACGPLMNIVAFMFFISCMPEFAIINLATAISNLLPLPEYDGYKIVSDFINLTAGHLISEKVMPNITIFIAAAAVFLSLFLIFTLNGGYWIFIVFFFVLLRKILFFQNHTKNEI